MKKTIFLGIAALLALALFSCGDDISLGDIDLPKEAVGSADGITLFGPEFATGRSLVGQLAEAGTDFYEATFVQSSSTLILRTTWSYARKGKIQLEPGAYKVILMAGRKSDKTLLGVGGATSIKNGTATATPITLANTLLVTIAPDTSELTFSVYPLMNDVNRNGGAHTTTPSTFQTAISLSLATTLPTTKDELGNTVPVFMITKDDETTATWKFGLGALPGATGDQIGIFGPSIFVTGTPAIYEVGFSAPDTRDVPQQLVDKSITAPANADAITGTVSISVTAPDDDGMLKVALDVPVTAIASTVSPVLWYIRGGLNNGDIDAGLNPDFAKPGKIGGALVLGFGNLSNFPEITLIPAKP